MEFVVLLLLLIIILFTLLSFKSTLSERIGNLEGEMRQLRQTLEDSRAKTTPQPPQPVTKEEIATQVKPEPEKETYWQSGFKKLDEPGEEEISEEMKAWLQTEPQSEEEPAGKPVEVVEQPFERTTPTPELKQPKPTFFERNPDLEKFIGENLISKIGIGILVLAIGYFVKFAIDNDWIGPVGRVAIGILCGGILVGVAHYMRNSYKAFSSVLVGGGIAVFYFTIALAYHQFHLFDQTPAFIIMVVITGFTVALSLLYDRQEVAIIALVGGFAAPFMVSNGSGNYKTLFTYLVLLNTGLLVLAYYKAWRLLNTLAFIFTVILVGGWLFSLPVNAGADTYRNGFLFLTIFYLLFFAINIANNIRENKKFLASDFSILLANTALYFSAGLFCLYQMNASGYKGLFSASMGVFNLGATYLLFRSKKIDANILYLLIGITLTFISLTGPLQLEGNHITLFWTSEAVLLYWLFQKSKIAIFEFSSAIVWVAMLVSLFMDWSNVYGTANKALAMIANRGFITTAYAAIASYGVYLLKKKDVPPVMPVLSVLSGNVFRITGLLLLFLAGVFEIYHQFHFYYPAVDLYWLYLELFTLAFVLLLLFIAKKQSPKSTPVNLQVALLEFCTIVYLLLISTIFDIQTVVLQSQAYNAQFTISHWLTVILEGIILYQLTGIFRNIKSIATGKLDTVAWVICIVVIIFLSAEMNILVRSLFYSSTNSLEHIQQLFIKTVLPILWGLCSFAFMWLGMKYKFRTLRIISLVLFSITLVKLFVYDIRNIPVGGKIAAFFSLGVLLLVVSFMYQRLKKIIIEDEQKTSV